MCWPMTSTVRHDNYQKCCNWSQVRLPSNHMVFGGFSSPNCIDDVICLGNHCGFKMAFILFNCQSKGNFVNNFKVEHIKCFGENIYLHLKNNLVQQSFLIILNNSIFSVKFSMRVNGNQFGFLENCIYLLFSKKLQSGSLVMVWFLE